MKVSISKSVGRAFEILEVFRELRRPATATEIRRQIDCPHSSVVAVLHNLVELEYLSYDRETKHFFPTYKIYRVSTWVQGALVDVSTLPSLAEAIAAETMETTTIASRNSIFLNVLQTHKGTHPDSGDFPNGIAFSLCRSVTGLVVLSQLDDEEIHRTVRYSARWSKTTKSDNGGTVAEVMEAVTKIRHVGYGVGFDRPAEGVGCVAYPLASPSESNPLVISVVGPTERIRTNVTFIREVVERYLRLYAEGVRDFSPPQHRKSTRRAEAAEPPAPASARSIVPKMHEPTSWRV